MIRQIVQPLYTAYIIVLFLATLFIVLPFYLLLSIPRNKKCRHLMWRLSRLWGQFWLLMAMMPVRRLNKAPQGRFVVIANHVSYLDPIVLFATLPWYFRPLAKKEISKAPLFGFIYGQMSLMVDRSSQHSRARSMRLMWRTLRHECSVFIYPEGTFNESEEPMAPFFDGAFRLALNTGTPILPLIFPDTKARWHYSHWWKIWPGRNRVLFLEPIPVEGMSMGELPALKEKVKSLMGKALLELGC